MYAEPPSRTTSVVARLPQELRGGEQAREMARLIGIPIDSFLEGPAIDADGGLLCLDIAGSRILALTGDGSLEQRVAYDGMPNGLKIAGDGRFIVADRKRGLISIDADGKIATLSSAVEIEPFRGLNDLSIGPDGTIWFTDQGLSDLAQPSGRVYRRHPDGRLEAVLTDLPGPNGIAFDGERSILYVAMTRSNAIWRAVALPDGSLTRVSLFIQLSGGGGPDGIALDAEGGLVVAQPQSGCLWHFDRRGRPILRIELSEGLLGTNIAFGGPDLRTLFITESERGAIHAVEMPVAGMKLLP